MRKHEEKYRMLGVNIAYYRKLRGLTQLQLTEITNISRTHISNIEAKKGNKPFSISVLFDIAEWRKSTKRFLVDGVFFKIAVGSIPILLLYLIATDVIIPLLK